MKVRALQNALSSAPCRPRRERPSLLVYHTRWFGFKTLSSASSDSSAMSEWT